MRNPKLLVSLAINLILLAIYWQSLSRPFFDSPLSTVLLDQNENLLSARIAKDGQWRFPARDSLPERFEKALICFEDRHFKSHFGVHLPSLVRAFKQNLSSDKRVSGGSTITMQVIRMMRGNPPRTYKEKLLEIILASRLELAASKSEILGLWASNAPFGGNVVGVDAASWRYFGRSPEELSWAEAATLAVLPNAPSLIFPGKNQQLLLEKRNRLLQRMMNQGIINEETCELAMLEPVPGPPHPLPQQAYHLMQTLEKEKGVGQSFHSTIDKQLQLRAEQILEAHALELAANRVYNMCALIIRVEDGSVAAYVGNVKGAAENPARFVDIIHSQRSTGSILKPLLYANMLDRTEILPGMLVPDVPVRMGNFSPENYSLSYDGAVPASRALARSLNIPAVHMLKQHGVEQFHKFLKDQGFSHLTRPPSHYGLSLILGGAEASMWEVTRTYASMSRSLRQFASLNGKYDRTDWLRQSALVDQDLRNPELTEHSPVSAAASYLCFQALLEVNRPNSETGWQWFSSSKAMAWKTGTSYGFRDAWSVGCTPDYVIGVWAGNATGEGRPGLTGVTAAAPVLFRLLDVLPTGSWFTPPYDELIQLEVCTESGHPASDLCPSRKTIQAPATGSQVEPCPYHIRIYLSPDRLHRANADCFPSDALSEASWFVLPPVQSWYYRKKHPEYRSLPTWHPDCQNETQTKALQMIYPPPGHTVYIPVDLDGRLSQVVFEAAHDQPEKTIFWHLDDTYLGQTREIHNLSCRPEPGEHKLVLVDEDGAFIETKITVLPRLD